MDAWIARLKAAHDAGYYRTEAAEHAQTPFPWQNKTCRDCPFWTDGLCLLFEENRRATAHTCTYFDPWNRPAARRIIHARRAQGFQPWWEWFIDRGAAR